MDPDISAPGTFVQASADGIGKGGDVVCVCVCVCVCVTLSRTIIREPLEGSESTPCGRAGSSLFKYVHVSPANNQQGVKERSCIIGGETQTWSSPLPVTPPPPTQPPPCVSPWALLPLRFLVTHWRANLGDCRAAGGNIQTVMDTYEIGSELLLFLL